jgi:hypothetical protein
VAGDLRDGASWTSGEAVGFDGAWSRLSVLLVVAVRGGSACEGGASCAFVVQFGRGFVGVVLLLTAFAQHPGYDTDEGERERDTDGASYDQSSLGGARAARGRVVVRASGVDGGIWGRCD